VPRVGLTGDRVVASAAGLADEIGFHAITMGLLADRLGIRAPSLYKHVSGLADVRHRLATLAVTELGEVIRDAVAGRAGRDALAAMLAAIRAYVSAHPGRYAATTGTGSTGPDDPLLVAGTHVIGSIAAVLRGYGLAEDEMNHAIRLIRSAVYGFAMLEASRGFQWGADPDQSFEWIIGFIDRGLRSACSAGTGRSAAGRSGPTAGCRGKPGPAARSRPAVRDRA
jgi:AcrR family transcriptional regulator